MKLKTSHLLIILVVLTAIVFFVKHLNTKKEKGTLLTEFFDINYDEINKFSITPQFNSAIRFDVINENGKWYILSPSGSRYEANQQFMNQALRELRKLKPSRLASTGPEKFPAFGVDSTGTLLEIFDDKGSYSIILGSMTFQNQSQVNTYCRLPDDNNTYAAEAYMDGTFKTDINGWRKRDIFASASSAWQTISIVASAQNISIQLKKNGNNWFINNHKADSTLSADLLTFLDRIRSLGFAGDSEVAGISQPSMVISVSENDSLQPVHVNLYRTPKTWLLNSSINEGNYFTADTGRINPLLLNLEALSKRD